MESIVIVARILVIPALVIAARDIGERAFDAAVGAAVHHQGGARFAAREVHAVLDDSDDERSTGPGGPAIAWKVMGDRVQPDWSRLCASDETVR